MSAEDRLPTAERKSRRERREPQREAGKTIGGAAVAVQLLCVRARAAEGSPKAGQGRVRGGDLTARERSEVSFLFFKCQWEN